MFLFFMPSASNLSKVKEKNDKSTSAALFLLKTNKKRAGQWLSCSILRVVISSLVMFCSYAIGGIKDKWTKEFIVHNA